MTVCLAVLKAKLPGPKQSCPDEAARALEILALIEDSCGYYPAVPAHLLNTIELYIRYAPQPELAHHTAPSVSLELTLDG